MPGHFSRLPNWIGDLALGLGLLQRRLELVERRRRRRDLLLVVEDADDLAHLREPVEVAGAEVLAVGRELVQVQQRRRVAVVPAVDLRVVGDRAQQPGLDQLAHDRAALVGLHDVRRVRARDRELDRLLQVLERLRDALDLDVRVLRLELLVELLRSASFWPPRTSWSQTVSVTSPAFEMSGLAAAVAAGVAVSFAVSSCRCRAPRRSPPTSAVSANARDHPPMPSLLLLHRCRRLSHWRRQPVFSALLQERPQRHRPRDRGGDPHRERCVQHRPAQPLARAPTPQWSAQT